MTEIPETLDCGFGHAFFDVDGPVEDLAVFWHAGADADAWCVEGFLGVELADELSEENLDVA